MEEFIPKSMEYNREDFLIESEDDEYIVSCVVDLMRRTFILYSNEGHSNIVNCETSEEFMNVVEVVRAVLPEKIVKYIQPYE